jgi:hypothetical protein
MGGWVNIGRNGRNLDGLIWLFFFPIVDIPKNKKNCLNISATDRKPKIQKHETPGTVRFHPAARGLLSGC